MTPEELRDFATRDWEELARLKTQYWLERKRALGPAEGIRVADQLRRHVRLTRPDWPSAEDREEDLAHHVRLGEMLRRVRTG